MWKSDGIDLMQEHEVHVMQYETTMLLKLDDDLINSALDSSAVFICIAFLKKQIADWFLSLVKLIFLEEYYSDWLSELSILNWQ